MVGSRTVIHDNPRLDVRHVSGRSPLRVVLDRLGHTPADSHVFDGSLPTLLFTEAQRPGIPHAEQAFLPPGTAPLPALLAELHRRQVRSLLVEGGSELLGHFLRAGLWDEAREIVGEPLFLQGTPAPRMTALPLRTFSSGNDRIHLYLDRHPLPDPAWPW